MSISIIKSTDQKIKLKVYDDYMTKTPIDLSQFMDLILAVTEDGRLLLEKKYSKNEIDISTDLTSGIQYIAIVSILKKDSENISINPSNEERIRTLEFFGIYNNRKITRFIKTEFYLEGSGYYVC